MAAVKPPPNIERRRTTIAILAMVLWFGVDFFYKSTPGFFYGKYGALLVGVLTAAIAKAKNRNAVVWLAFGSWFVLAALIVLAFLPRLNDAICVYCKEGVAADATVCPHCRHDIGAKTSPVKT